MRASGATAQPLDSAKPGNLTLRLVSAAVLAPLALSAVWAGSLYFAGLVVLAAAVMGWEWARLTLGPNNIVAVLAMIGIEAIAAGLAGVEQWIVALAVLGIGATGAGVLVLSLRGRAAAIWGGLGLLWIGLPCIGAIWLRAMPGSGRSTLLWLFALVWATDSAAYFTGRSIGGPRLAPRISAAKTWSGAAGGLLAGLGVGGIAGSLAGQSLLSPVLWVSLGLSVAAEAGDLLESAAKRRFGAKDSSGLIPGHGGILDRLDAMLAVLLGAVLLSLIGGATPLDWQ